ncbi:GNAT family N-acetyltransferase [Phenylobacterium sp.]|uniref:GNAT family N-acetyltransferase n=1 Tax=Phenylobacterium sp. TaxID=1871053 RepID=UPI003D2CD9EC
MDIRTATRADEARLLDTITLAFAADPIVRYWWTTASEHLEWWPRFVLAMGERGLDAGACDLAADFEGAALWMPPGVEPEPARIAALNLPGTEESAEVSAAFRAEMDRYHPTSPHWYLWTLGVDPRCQGRGIGSALLKHRLTQIDADGATAYLEASDPKNVPFYERHGFEALGVIEVADIPPLTPMLRPARR